MAIASWSTRRILTLWASGLVLQALLVLAPVLLARLLIGSNAQLIRSAAEQDARWRAGDLADSLSLAKQRADARAARTYSITTRGDTLFPLVRVPSGRPDPTVVAALVQQSQRNARYATAVIFGLIPTVLILVTVIWLAVRRKEAGPPP
jgi:hypothetical protein